MRHALPIWYCLDYETQAKLAKMLDEPDNIPPCLWKEWPASDVKFEITPLDLHSIEEAEMYYDREMRKPPSRSRG